MDRSVNRNICLGFEGTTVLTLIRTLIHNTDRKAICASFNGSKLGTCFTPIVL